ncbi:MAG: GAF domain-containing protein, partial [Anaerolineales bacterium]
AEAARAAGMESRDVYNIQLAVDEAASNIVEHAYKDIPNGTIEITCHPSPGLLKITLRDFGESFDPSAVESPNLEAGLEERAIGGLGLFLMSKLMDEVNFQPAPEGGNLLTLVKRSAVPSPAPPMRRKRADWRAILDLGSRVIDAETFHEQCNAIQEVAAQIVEGEVSLWLDEAFFRLPDWTETVRFPPTPPDKITRRARERRRVIRAEEPSAVAVALPIIAQDLLFGVLTVRRSVEHPFTRRDIQMLDGLARQAGVALVAAHRIAVEQFRLEQLNLVRSVSAQVANVQDVDELASRVARLIQLTFKYYYVAIFTLEPGQQVLTYRAGAGAVARKRGAPSPVLTVSLGQGLIGLAAESGQEILSNDVSQEPRFRHVDSLPETRSEVVLPIKIENRVLGVLDVQSDQLHAFHPNDLLILRALADSIAIALEGARLYTSLRRRADLLEVVAGVGRAVTSILDLHTMMETVAELVFERTGFPYVHLFTVHPNRRQIHYQAGGGARSMALDGYMLSLDEPEGLIPWVARNGQTVLANDVTREPRYRPSPFPPSNTQSELVVPLIYNNNVIGVLDVQSDVRDAFSEEDRLLFEALGEFIAAAIHNADLYRSEQWRRQVADSLREVAGLLSANASLEEVLDRILTELERNLPSDIATIWLLGDDDMYLAAVHGARAQDVEMARRAYAEANAWLMRALLARQPLIRRESDPLGPSGIAGGFAADYSSIAAPLRIGDQSVGVLNLSHHTPGRYGHEAQAMVTTFASYAAVAIENARLYDSAQEQAYASAALLQIAQAVVSLSELDDILTTIVRVLPILVGVERAAIYLWDAETETLRPAQQYGLPPELLPSLWRTLAPAEFPLLAAAIETLQPALSLEAHLGPENWTNLLPPDASDSEYILQADDRLLMVFPLNIKDALFGVLLAEEAVGGRRFRNRRIEILTGVAQQAAMAIQNDRFLQESRARERLETEVELARQIQQTFIPTQLPTLPNWTLATLWRTARQMGGDFFDIFELPGKRLGLFIADVADKGVPAALFMALTRTLVRAAVTEIALPGQALQRVNRLLYPDTAQGMFVTAFYGVLDTETGLFTYANAGHNPPLWVRAASVERLTRTGMALGVVEELDITQQFITLAPGDALVIYTDGITEAFSPEGEMFGETRLAETARQSIGGAASDMVERIETAVNDFMGGIPPADDLTMVVLKRNPR